MNARHTDCHAPTSSGWGAAACRKEKSSLPSTPPCRRADGQGRACFEIDQAFFGSQGPAHGITGHHQHRAAGQETDRGHVCQLEGVQRRLDDDPAAYAADGPGHRGGKADKQHQNPHARPLFLCVGAHKELY